MSKSDNTDETLTETEVEELLHRACDTRTRVKITFSDDEQMLYSNMVHLYQSHLLLDGFSPPSRKSQLRKGMRIEVFFAMERQGLFYFPSAFQGMKGSVGEQFLVGRPDRIRHMQRRRTYRVDPQATLSAEVISIGKSAAMEKVRVENISLDGACLSFPRPADIPVGFLLQDIRIRLQDEPDLILNGVVRSSYPGDDRRFRLGLEWEITEKEQRKTLLRYINACQRSETKRRH